MKNRGWIALIMGLVLALFPSAAFASNQPENAAVRPTAQAAKQAAGAEDSGVVWEASDFTYGDYEKELYGCDYTREFTVSGKVVTGFSEEGLEKWETCKDLVLPAKDADGSMLVGVGEHAFENRGLTSVTFPTGMMIPYDDPIKDRYPITRRGNYIIAESAFAKNALTEVYLPGGVIAVLPNAFQNNQITKVTIPRTIWWIETLAFANNQITNISFPDTTDFMFEMHGMAFADNKIKSVVIPDYTEVINKHVFVLNPGMEECPAEAGDKETGLGGVVYMYTDNLNLKNKDRIHHMDRPTASQKSWHQKLIVLGGPNKLDETAASSMWTLDDFTLDGTTITGLSESGAAKRPYLKDLVLPNINKAGEPITELASSSNSSGGLFATADEKFDSVRLPSSLLKIGQNAFAEARLKDVVFPAELEEIGMAAFRDNDLTSVILPDSLTVLGNGAFASNPGLRHISLSTGVTDIADSAFGCSDAKHWMTDLREIEIPDTVMRIGKRAFAANNFTKIVIPDSVKVIDEYAFSTKNYLRDPCTVELPEGLTTIGNRAFRNKVIAEIRIPTTVMAIPAKTFEKEYSDDFKPPVTKVYVSSLAQYEDKVNFASTEYHEIIYEGADKWTAEDFTYDTYALTTSDMVQVGNDTSTALTGDIYVVSGLSDSGKKKLAGNQDLVISEKDPSGRRVQGIGQNAFKAAAGDVKIRSVTLPETERVDNTGLDPAVAKRGDFFILDGAFSGNEITDLTIPEGTLFIARQAFANNKLTNLVLPESLMVISQQAFAGNTSATANELVSVGFPEKTDFPLFIGAQSFAFNKIQAVQLPEKTAAVNKYAFFNNPGKEPVTEGTANEKKGGIVYMYITDETPSSAIAHIENPAAGNFGKSNIQKLISGAIPAEDAPWGTADFTYNEEGSAITGLSESGKTKIKANPNLVLPDEGPDGTVITEIGPGPDNSTGTFTYTAEDSTVYAPVSVKLPAGLKKIGNYAFVAHFDISTGEQTGLMSVDFPETLEEIGMMAFRYAPLSSVELPDSVTTLGAGVFATSEKAQTLMTAAKLSDSLTAIPANLFSSQTLAAIDIPEGVVSIGNYAFNGSPLTELALPSTLTSIGNYAFQNHQLEELEVPASVTKVGNYAFKNFQESKPKTLETLTLHEGLVSIGKEAFAGSKLKTAEIPESLTTLDADAFKSNESGVSDGRAVLLSKNEDQASATGAYTKVVTEGSGHIVQYSDKIYGTGWNEYDFTYSADGSAITGWSESGNAKRFSNHEVVFPDRSPSGVEITAIADNAFAMTESEVTIGKYECVSPDGIQKVVLPVNLTYIGAKAFEYNNLQEITFTDDLAEIGDSAFHGNHLKSVHIPNTVTVLGNGAFAMNDITDLVLSDQVTVIPQGAFSMNIRLDRITIPETVTEVGDMAFAGARLTTLTIPASVTRVGRKAFHLHRLKELTVPGTVKEICDNAFEGTYKGTTLKKLTLEEGIESIGSGAFKEGLLEEVDLPASLQTMGSEPFENNTGENGEGVVLLHSENAAHLKFNQGARTHRVVLSKDQEAAAAVIDQINALPDPVGAEDEASVTAAQEMYDALTDAQKAIVDADPAKAKLETAKEQLEKIKDQAAANTVIDQINALPDPVSAENEAAVTAAQDAYDALTDAQKAIVDADPARARLDAAKEQIAAAKDQAAADAVAEKINALPAEITADNEADVAAAKKAYDELTDAQKAKVDPAAVEKLSAAEAAVVKAKIEALPENAGTADEAAVEAAQKAYDALTDEQKAALGDDVKNKLETAAKQVSDAKAAEQKAGEDAKTAEGVASKISALPAADKVTLADKSKVEEAAKAYDALTEDQKKAVPEDVVKKLEDAKNAIAALEKEEQDEEAAGHETLAAFDSKVTSASSEDPAGTEFGKLQAKVAKKVGKNNLKVQWKAVSGASVYVIYANKAGKKNKYVKVAEVKGKTSYALKKIKGKKLAKNTYYKVLVAAVKTTKGGTVRVIAKAKPVYAATSGGKNGNPTKLTVNKSKVKVKVKKSFKLKVKQAKPSGKKIVKKRAIKYESSDKSIATVSAKGVIKGRKAGKCKIYIYAQNGLMKTVKVTVKK